MKNFIIRAAVALLSACTASATFAYSPRLDGTMMPYDFEGVDSIVPWKSGMSPVFVSYIARHGARYLSSSKKTEGLRSRLEEARRHGRLTEKGHRLLSLIERVDSVTDDRWGALTPLGIEEEARLGKELTAVAPSLFKDGTVTAASTYVPRVVMTMYEFCHSLADYSSNLEVSTAEGKSFNPLLRYFTTDKPYVSYIDQGPWRYAYDAYASAQLPTAPAAAIINEVADAGELRKISMDTYGILQSLGAAGIEADVSEWFTEEEYASCWKVSNLKHYYQRSVSTFSPIAAESAKPLLRRIADNIDHHPEERRADLMFGHAETVIPLFALMRLPGCYSPSCEPEKVAEQWKDWYVSPLGANLMIVALEDGGGDRYVSLRLNGQWIEIEGESVIAWSKLKSYWGLAD